MVESKRRLGRYSLVAEIARGAMGIVYLAETTDPPVVPPQNARASRPPPSFDGHTLFCVKRLRSDLDDEEKFKAMFLDEARLATRLVHRNIVYTHETGDDGERLWLVMEYLEGRTLQSALRLRGEHALSLPTILRITCNVLAGLHYAHEVTDDEGAPLGIVHRDVSAHNVFLTYDGQVKVLDFGVAQAFGRTSHTDAGGIKGRLTSLAPERVTAGETVDRRADVFSVGALLREAITGQPVWNGTEIEVLRDLVANEIPAFPEDVDVAPELREIVERAMAPDREQRFRTAHAMRAAIEQYVSRIDPSGSLASMSEVLQRAYATHRVHARKVIEDHFAHGPAPADALSVPPLPDLPSFPSSSASIAAAIASSLPPPSVASEPPPEVILLETYVRPPLASDAGMPLLDDAPPEPTPPPLAPRIRRPRRRRSFVYVGSVAAVVLAMVALYVARPRRPLLATTTPAPAVGAVASAASEGEQLELRIQTTPTAAQIIVDDVAVGASSWRGLFARGTHHAVRVVAAGHAPKTSHVTLDQPLVLNVQLDPMSAVPAPATAPPIVAGPRMAPRPVAAVAPSATQAETTDPPAPPATDVFTGGQAPQRPIDPKSPYE